ncbi:MAG: tetratricopeptide repeat protein [Woeseiaceae bacterium]
MIVTERFVFIHLHKTGGQSLNDVIKRCIVDHNVVGYHYPRAQIPPASTALPVVGIVRNPWDWYVSWYAFNKRPNIHNQLFNVVSNGGQLNFRSTITNLINLGSNQPASQAHREDLVHMLPDSLEGNRGAGLTKDTMRNFSNDERGYCSWLFDRMLGDPSDEQVYVGRFENLQDDFLQIMEQLAVPELESLRAELDESGRRNASRHSHYSHYYDGELRDLVAEKDRALIENFDYQFESIRPDGISYEFPADIYTGPDQGFKKLLGRESNFLKLHDNFDVGPLQKRIETIPAAKWLESERERLFDVHRDTQALLLVHFEDFKYEKPDYRELYFELQNELHPLVDYVSSYYKNNGFIVRLLLAKLLVGGKIPQHTDAGYSLLNCHRVHLPIITNDKVDFLVGGETKNMQVGELWEINNGSVHAVENRGDEDRIHLIIDWMPNEAGESEEAVLAAGRPGGPDAPGIDPAELNAMVGQGHQLHQAGQFGKAESQYRQVLNADENHVIANNLMGLLCLQTKRLDEAVNHIESALKVMPDDAQAHANLALALKDLGRTDDAARHFHESLKLVPTNPRVYNNLGGLYVEARRVKDAIKCYEQALAIQPAFAEGHYNLGNAFMLLHRYNEASACFQQCLTLKPDFTECQTRLVQALQGAQRQEQASP